MELTGTACNEALNGAEEAGRRERARGNAGGDRLERRVRLLDDLGDLLLAKLKLLVIYRYKLAH